jgi:hypothetical protein
MIVVVDSKGVPSVARWIHLGGASPPPPPPSGAPRAGFTASPLSGPTPLTVSFRDASAPAPTSWEWDFDHDGHIDSTQRNPQITYSTPGIYTVSLTDPPPPGPQSSQAPPPAPESPVASGSSGSGDQATGPPIPRAAGGVTPRPGCKVPRLRGKTRSAARDDLADAGCAVARLARREYSTRVRRGRVSRTVPSAGAWTTRQVRVVVSMGRRKHRAGRPRVLRTASVGLLCPLLGRAAVFARA